MEINFCRRCGSQLNLQEDQSYVCENQHVVYPNPAPCAGVLLLRDNSVLVAVRDIEPRKGGLDSFGGFLEVGESFEEALERELQEELSLERDEYAELHYITSHKGLYEKDGEARVLVVVFYWARLKTRRELLPSDDVADIAVIALSELSAGQFEGAPDVQAAITKLKDLHEKGALA